MARARPATKRDRALQEIYDEIPRIPDCSGKCAVACGPIAMFKFEYQRVTHVHGRKPRLRPGSITCPMLSPNGWCTVYTVRPFICRLWGTTPSLKCPEGCEPERWLTKEEAHELFRRVQAIAGPEIDGTMGSIEDLWEGFALEAREERIKLIERIKESVRNG